MESLLIIKKGLFAYIINDWKSCMLSNQAPKNKFMRRTGKGLY